MRFLSKEKLSPYDIGILLFIGTLAFSYLPVATLGTWHGIHIDLSAIYVMVSSFTVWSLFRITKEKRHVMPIPIIILSILAVYSSISILWSLNPIRGIITSLFLWLLTGIVASMTYATERMLRLRRHVFMTLLIVYVVIVLWALWQLIGDALGISPTLTLLPLNYQSAVFGVARPTGFALEPQFFSSMLLIPFLWSAHRLLHKQRDLLTSMVFVSAAMLQLLALSRGGLLASCVGLLVLSATVRPSYRRVVTVLALCVMGFVIGLAIQYTLAALNTRDVVSGSMSVEKSIEQLSLGAVSFQSKDPVTSVTKPRNPSVNNTNSSGYISSSTTSRLTMSQKAIELWQTSPRTILFGVGSGSFGASLHKTGDLSASDGTVANNIYLETLAELGVIGFGLFATLLVTTLLALYWQKQWLLLSLLMGFVLQWSFFSGNANVIHVWVLLGIAIALTNTAAKKHTLINT